MAQGAYHHCLTSAGWAVEEHRLDQVGALLDELGALWEDGVLCDELANLGHGGVWHVLSWVIHHGSQVVELADEVLDMGLGVPSGDTVLL